MRSQTQTQLLIKRHFKTIFFRDSTHSAHGISQPPLVQDLSVLKMKNPFKMFNEKKGSCVAIFGKTKVSSIESTERLLECGGGQKFFWMESWWSPVDRLGAVVAKMGTVWSSPCAEPGRWCAVGKPPSLLQQYAPPGQPCPNSIAPLSTFDTIWISCKNVFSNLHWD